MRAAFLIATLCTAVLLFGQRDAVDSLARAVRESPTDSARARLLNSLGRAVFSNDPKAAVDRFLEAIEAIDRAQAPRDTSLLLLRGEVLNNLGAAQERLSEYTSALRYYRQAIDLRSQLGDDMGLARTYGNLAVLLRKQGDPRRALDANLQALEHARRIPAPELETGIMINLALLYQYLELDEQAHGYYRAADSLARARADSSAMARILNGRGGLYHRSGANDSALHCFGEALRLRKGLGDPPGMATVYSNLGDLAEVMGNTELAIAYLDSCIAIRAPRGDRSGLAGAHGRRSTLLLKIGRKAEALEHARIAHDLARRTANLNDILQSARTLSVALAANGDHRRALDMLNEHLLAKDSLNRSERAQELLREDFRLSMERLRVSDSLAMENERALNEARMHELRSASAWQRMALGIAALGFVLLMALLRTVRNSKRRSDELLRNILPAQVAEELKRDGRAQAVRYDQATVIFADIVDFTSLSELLGPEELVRLLDTCFSAFDIVASEHGAEKIKTVGDAYMAVCGVPDPTPDHALAAARTALGMLNALERLDLGGNRVSVRIGLHSGPVVAGIVGLNKFQYDIWGDTVNTTARMQAASEPGRINVSGAARAAIGDRARFEPRRAQYVKGKGDMEMHFLVELR